MNKILEQLLESPIKNEKFIKELKSYIDAMSHCKSVLVSEENEYHWKSLDKKLIIKFTSNGIEYELKLQDKVYSGKAIKYNEGTLIKTVKRELTSFKLNRKMFVKHEKEEIITKLYNNEEIQIFEKKVEINKNYSEHKYKKEKTLLKPDVFENYTETTYKWRTLDNQILERNIVKYAYPEDALKGYPKIKNKDVKLIKIGPEYKSKELSSGGYYYGFEDEMFFKYMQGNSNIDEIKKYVYVKYRDSIFRDTHWI